MLELAEREEQAAAEEKLSAERSAHAALMKEANLDGVETLIDDMVRQGMCAWPCVCVLGRGLCT